MNSDIHSQLSRAPSIPSHGIHWIVFQHTRGELQLLTMTGKQFEYRANAGKGCYTSDMQCTGFMMWAHPIDGEHPALIF